MFHDPRRFIPLFPAADNAKAQDRPGPAPRASLHWQSLDPRHTATFTDNGASLLVSFATAPAGRTRSLSRCPPRFDLVQGQGWSHLCLISEGETWFRSPEVYAFFDQLIDDGFFDEFSQVLFYGAGSCGYAAAAYSVSAPGATVVAVQPQATLDRDRAGWDNRFAGMRRVSFSDRFGYAPDMLDAAARAFVIYDPRQLFDAMHAALFDRPNVTRLRLRGMGPALHDSMTDMKILAPVLTLAAADDLTEDAFYRLSRARRDNTAYLNRLMTRLDAAARPALNNLLCRNVAARLPAPRFRRRLEALNRQAKAGFDPLG